MAKPSFKCLMYLLLLVLIIDTAPADALGRRCNCEDEPRLSMGKNKAASKDLRELQTYLKHLKLYSGNCHGIFDGQTAQSICGFQKRRGLAVTGIVDKATWSALGDSVLGQPVTALPPAGNLRIVVDTGTLTLTVLLDGQPFKSFPVAIGKRETPSPVGSWTVVNKGRWEGGFGTRWLGLNVPYGLYGIHGTNKPWSIGRMESHGCIRMYNRDVEVLYSWVKTGTPVNIIGDPFAGRRRLVRGERGGDVYYLQVRLKQLGYYSYRPDGVFGYGTEKALKDFQKAEQIKVTGQVGWPEYNRLRLVVTE